MVSSDQQNKVYIAKRIADERDLTHPAVIDSEYWDQATVLTNFTFPWSERNPPETRFCSLWNTSNFIFRFVVRDDDIVLAEGADSLEKVIGSDRVEIFFSTSYELNPYYGIEMDPRGEILDYEARHHRKINWNWECEGLIVHSRITDTGYVVEGTIPLSTFQKLSCLHEDQSGMYLIAGLYRAEFRYDAKKEKVIEDWMSWVEPDGDTPDFHVPSSFGIIRLV